MSPGFKTCCMSLLTFTCLCPLRRSQEEEERHLVQSGVPTLGAWPSPAGVRCLWVARTHMS